MNKYTFILSDIMSIALFLASLPVAASHHDNPSPSPNNYFIFNQFNTIQSVLPLSSLNEQQLGLPYAPPQVRTYRIPGHSNQEQPNIPTNENGDLHKVSNRGLPYGQPPIKIYFYRAGNDAVEPTRHKCPVENCTKSYSRLSDLRNHIRANHPPYAEANNLFEGGKYPCSVKGCPARFTRMKALKTHEKKEHNQRNLHYHYTDATNTDSNEAEQGCEAPVSQGDEDYHGPQEQAQPQPQPQPSFSLSFICNE